MDAWGRLLARGGFKIGQRVFEHASSCLAQASPQSLLQSEKSGRRRRLGVELTELLLHRFQLRPHQLDDCVDVWACVRSAGGVTFSHEESFPEWCL
jgi:hypothetical protein